MRHYHPTEADRWKNFLNLSHWHLKMRINDVILAREYADESIYTFRLSLLRESYENDRFLREFLGYRRMTKLEQRAAALLASSSGPSTSQAP